MQRITRTSVTPVCAICERTLLMGERAVRFSPDGDGDLVDVCPLCQDTAVGYGWLKEGSPTTPTLRADRRRKALSLPAIFGARRALPESALPEPILRRLSEPEQAMVEATDLFNASDYPRTVAGIARSLGEPRVSIVPLSGVNTEVVITVAWEISWYQYRVSFEAPQPVRLAERGLELDELDGLFRGWNAHLADDGRVVAEIARF